MKDFFKIANKKFKSRLIVGTGKYKNFSECAKAIKQIGYKITEVDIANTDIAGLAKINANLCFNALHGDFGEDGSIQGLLNLLKPPAVICSLFIIS